jgi:hypothetical protein
MNQAAEYQLLLLAMDPVPTPETREHAEQLLRGPLDWDRLLESASWQGVHTLLLHLLRSVPAPGVPESVLARLTNAYRTHVMRSLLIQAQLPRVLQEFEAAHVPAVVLKGAALANTLYPDPALRPMGDIDILIPPERLTVAEQTLQRLGYRFEGNLQPDYYRRQHYHITYVPPDSGLPIELHWHIARVGHPTRICITDPALMDRWFERAETVDLQGFPARVLCAPDLVLHLALHFLKHRFDSHRSGFVSAEALKQLADIRLVLRARGALLDWKLLWQEAQNYQVHEPLATALALALDPLGRDSQVPTPIDGNLGPEGRAAVKLMRRRIFVQDDAQRIYARSVHRYFGATDYASRTRSALGVVFPPREMLARKHGLAPESSRLYLHYLVRPFTLLIAKYRMRRDAMRLREEGSLRRWLGVVE